MLNIDMSCVGKYLLYILLCVCVYFVWERDGNGRKMLFKRYFHVQQWKESGRITMVWWWQRDKKGRTKKNKNTQKVT